MCGNFVEYISMTRGSYPYVSRPGGLSTPIDLPIPHPLPPLAFVKMVNHPQHHPIIIQCLLQRFTFSTDTVKHFEIYASCARRDLVCLYFHFSSPLSWMHLCEIFLFTFILFILKFYHLSNIILNKKKTTWNINCLGGLWQFKYPKF